MDGKLAASHQIITILAPGSPALSVDRLALMTGWRRERVHKLCEELVAGGYLEMTFPKEHQRAKNQGQHAFRNQDRGGDV